jgi:hypothetical protein
MNRPRAARVGGGLVALFVVAAAIYAYRSLPVKAQSGGAAAGTSTVQGTSSQISAIDPATGLPRDPTPAELQALQSQQTVAVPPEPIVSPTTGLQGLQLSEDQMVYSVATKKADGTVTISEVDGKRAADRAVTSGKAPELLIRKEARDDR